MKYYVDQLLDCLDLYQSLIRQGIFGMEYAKQINKLNEEIDLLREISHSTEKELLSYDYKLLKKDLARLFHSDHLSDKSFFLEDPDALLGKTFGILDDIDKYQKQDATRTYSTGSYYYDDQSQYEDTPKYGEERKRRRQYSNPEPEYKEEYSETYRRNTEDVQYENYQYDTDTWFTYKVWFTEKFNYLFRGIPYSSEEYDNLYLKYQKKCEKYIEDIKLLNAVIKQLEKELNLLNIEKHNAISKEKIDSLYQSKLEKLYRKASKASSEVHYYKSQLEYRKSMLKPKIEEAYSYWLQDKKNCEAKYNRLLSFYNYQRANFVTMDYKKLEKEISDTYNFINDNFMDPVGSFREIEARILEADETYRSIKEKYDEAYELFEDADLNYKNYCANPEVHKRHIKEPIEKEYERRQRELRSTLAKKRRRKEHLETILEATQRKQDDLVNTYGHEFGSNQRYGR